MLDLSKKRYQNNPNAPFLNRMALSALIPALKREYTWHATALNVFPEKPNGSLKVTGTLRKAMVKNASGVAQPHYYIGSVELLMNTARYACGNNGAFTSYVGKHVTSYGEAGLVFKNPAKTSLYQPSSATLPAVHVTSLVLPIASANLND